MNSPMPAVTHEHLKTLIEDIYLNENRLTEDYLLKLVNELRYSSLYIPAKSGDGTLDFIIYEMEGKKFTPLFTDLDEYHKFFRGEDLRILSNTFEIYRNVLKTKDIDGYILNPASQNYILEKDLILSITHIPDSGFIGDDSYTRSEIREIYENIENASLNDFISRRENVGDYQALFEEFSKSTLVTMMLSTRKLESEDGIVDMSKTGHVAFMHVDKVGGRYVTIYSHPSRLNCVNVDSKLFKYAQVINLSTLVNYILSEDMDGIILNPDSDNILIPRGELLLNSLGFERYCNDSRMMTAIFYIFYLG